MSETIYGRLITKAFTGAATIPPSADHSNGDWISTDIYEHELYIDDATGKLYTNINGVITQLNPTPTDTNLANTDLTQTGNRVYDLGANSLEFDGGYIGINTTPIKTNQLSVDAGAKHYAIYATGTTGVGVRGESTDGYGGEFESTNASGIYGQSDNGAGVYGKSDNAPGVVGLSVNSYGVSGKSNNADGIIGESTTGIGVYGMSSGATGVWGNGGIVAESFSLGSSRDTSAVLQANSTTQGALLPRMTTTQRNAIGTPATGLEIYNTTTGRKEVYNGTFWQGISMRFLNVLFTQWNPSDAQTVAFGQAGGTPQLTSLSPAPFEIVMRGNGVIRGCDFTTFAGGVAGTNENWSLYVRHSGTDYLVQTVGNTAATKVFTNTSLNIPYVAGDIVRMVFINPTWATNPTQVVGGGFLTLQ